jgi:hypothetical protein
VGQPARKQQAYGYHRPTAATAAATELVECKYGTQLGCEADAIVDQGEPIVGSAVATLAFLGGGSYKVAGAFFTAYVAQLVAIREQCVESAWGPNAF